MDEKILIIDDDEPMHFILENLLGDEYDLLNAKNAQRGIDILAKKPVDLILCDIHMPGISGLEFLESIMADAEKKNIPILIMTSLPSVEKEQKALDLGAADFIDKDQFNTHKEEVINRIHMKLVSNFDRPDPDGKINLNTKKLGKILMSEAVSGDFFSASRKFCLELKKSLNFDYISQWSIRKNNTSLLMSLGKEQPRDYGADNLLKEDTFKKIMETKESSLCNHVSEDGEGLMAEFSKEHNLPAEIAIPLFALSEKKYLQNNRKIPDGTLIFSLMVFKRNMLYTTTEFKLLNKLFAQASTILWRLFKEI